MSPDDLDELGGDLYQEFLIDHYKNPRNAGVLEGAEIDHDGDNPTCGDMIHVYARVNDKKEIAELRFKGKGCAISQASASILFEDLKGKRLEDVKPLDIRHVQELLGLTIRPARVKCATLGLVVLKEGIKDYESRSKPKRAVPGFKKAAGG